MIENSLNAAKQRMLERDLRGRGITDERVLSAMERVPREKFVPPSFRDESYDDRALPIELGQTISQPYTVAFMAQTARLQGHERVLEIGTGSGYGAAVLSQLTADVVTIERLPSLAEPSRVRLQTLGFDNVSVRSGDGAMGCPDAAPFDAIIVTAAAEELPRAYFAQLRDGGRIVIPIGRHGAGQTMFRCTRQGEELIREELGLFSFVPLISESSSANVITPAT